ncbi:MAG: transglutaminase domain-containing protein [Candidatus Rifleibacteriota bacterium]
MKKAIVFFLFFLALPQFLHAFDQKLIERFFPREKQFLSFNRTLRVKLPDMKFRQAEVSDFNQAVEYNNQGLEELRNKNYKAAETYFSRACKLAPGEKGFWNNRLLAARKIEGKAVLAVELARKVMALDPENSQAAQIAGLILLNDMERPLDAIAFLNYALERDQENVSLAVALATAYENAGYKESAFNILKNTAFTSTNDAYPHYMLGLHYLERQDYNPAIRAFEAAMPLDNKGYSHDAWIRARFYAGQLDGLANECKKVLRRFSNLLNKESLERILFALEPQDFRLEEKIKVRVTRPSNIERLDFLVKPVPDIESHQSAKLVQAQILSGGSNSRARITEKKSNGYLRLSVPKEYIKPDFTLKLVYRIKTRPLLATDMADQSISVPAIDYNNLSEKYAVNNSLLALMADRIERRGGNYVQTATIAVNDGLKYKENFKDYSVEWAFNNPDNCDCTEYSRMLAALCLRKQKPARMVTGFLVKPELMGQETSIGHAWCEVFFPRRGWIPIDPTLQSSMKWAYFGNLLSDQIYFGEAVDDVSRISIDYTSTSSDLQVSLSNTFKITNW